MTGRDQADESARNESETPWGSRGSSTTNRRTVIKGIAGASAAVASIAVGTGSVYANDGTASASNSGSGAASGASSPSDASSGGTASGSEVPTDDGVSQGDSNSGSGEASGASSPSDASSGSASGNDEDAEEGDGDSEEDGEADSLFGSGSSAVAP